MESKPDHWCRRSAFARVCEVWCFVGLVGAAHAQHGVPVQQTPAKPAAAAATVPQAPASGTPASTEVHKEVGSLASNSSGQRKLPVIATEGSGNYIVLPTGRYLAHDGKVVVMTRFAIAETETTTAQYMACVKAGGCSPPEWAEEGNRYHLMTGKDAHYAGFTDDERPIVGVSWSNAQQFAAWMSRQNPGRTFRLPSETEWEYAAGGTMRRRWAHGDDESITKNYAWIDSNSKGRSQPVGLKLPNSFGLMDMAGNVWEWVQDCSTDRLVYGDARAYEDPLDRSCSRVVRGGSWNYPAAGVALNARQGFQPIYRNRVIGFRLALDVK